MKSFKLTEVESELLPRLHEKRDGTAKFEVRTLTDGRVLMTCSACESFSVAFISKRVYKNVNGVKTYPTVCQLDPNYKECMKHDIRFHQ
jgi:hypothetical protein